MTLLACGFMYNLNKFLIFHGDHVSSPADLFHKEVHLDMEITRREALENRAVELGKSLQVKSPSIYLIRSY